MLLRVFILIIFICIVAFSSSEKESLLKKLQNLNKIKSQEPTSCEDATAESEVVKSSGITIKGQNRGKIKDFWNLLLTKRAKGMERVDDLDPSVITSKEFGLKYRRNAAAVGIDESVILSGRDKRYIYTMGMGPCVGVLLYDKASNATALMHLSPTVDSIDLINNTIAKMKILGVSSENLECNVFGGDDCTASKKSLDIILNKLSDSGVKVKNMDVLGDEKNDSDKIISVFFDREKKKLFSIK